MNYLDMESKKVSSWGSTYRNFDLIVRKQIKARSKAKYLIENAKIKKETVGVSGTSGSSGSSGTSGVSGTFGTHCATGSYNVAIEYQALSRCNDIGIGTTSPKVKLDMESNEISTLYGLNTYTDHQSRELVIFSWDSDDEVRVPIDATMETLTRKVREFKNRR